MQKKATKLILIFLISLTISYTLYIFFLQPVDFFSKQRLGISILIGLGLFFLLVFLTNRFNKKLVIDKVGLWGSFCIFLTLNLVIFSFLPRIPYPIWALPQQKIEITPQANQQSIKIQSLKTDLADRIQLETMTFNEGWTLTNHQLIYEGDQAQMLAWEGQPGQNVEIQFASCSNCGEVQINWGDQVIETIDPANGEITIEHNYSSLFLFRLSSLIVLQISIGIITLGVIWWGQDILKAPLAPSASKYPRLRSFSKHPWFPVISLCIMTVIVYGFKLQPMLFNDDWSIYYYVQFDYLEAFMLNERRPMHWFWNWFFNQIWPPDIALDLTFLFIVVILFLSSVLLYKLTLELLPDKKWFAFLLATLCLVFPSDYTRLYMTMANHRFAIFLLLIAMIFSTKLMRTNRLIFGLLNLPILSISLLIYEGQLGLMIAWPIILAILYRKELTRQKIFGLSGFFLLTVFFTIWRLWIQPQFFFEDSKLENIGLSLGEIIERYLQSTRTILIGFRTPFPDSSWLSIQNLLIVILVLMCSAGLYILISFLSQSSVKEQNQQLTFKNQIAIFSIGIVLWVAGYFPILLNYEANIYGHISRINLFSIAGAALMLMILIYAITSMISAKSETAINLTALTIIALIFLGSIVQIQTQESYNQSWDEKKAFFQALFAEVPDIKPETHFYFFLEGFGETSNWYRPLFSSSWEAATSIRTLYDHKRLRVSYQYDQITVPKYPGFNILPSTLESENIIPITQPSQLMIIRFNRETNDLEILENSNLLPDYDLSGYAPYKRILPLEQSIPARKIVE